MKRFGVVFCTFATVLFGMLSTAAADQQGVVIVDFETFDVDEALLERFYDHVEAVLDDHDQLSKQEIGQVTMDELMLMAGCDAPHEECLTAVGDLVDGDQLLFGSIERSEDVHMFTMSLFDFQSGEFEREISDQTLQGDADWLADGMPAVVEHLLYGATATVDVQIDGASDAEVQVNGESAGTGSVTVEDVAPGEVSVVATAGDDEQQERFIVRHDEEKTVEFSFEEVIADIDDPDAAPSLVPGLAVGGAGVAATVLGFVGQAQLAGADARADSLIDGRGAVDADQHSELQEIEGELTRANTMRWIGFSAGAIGLAGGGFLLYQAFTHDADADSIASERDLRIDVGASDEGVSAGFRLSF